MVIWVQTYWIFSQFVSKNKLETSVLEYDLFKVTLLKWNVISSHLFIVDHSSSFQYFLWSKMANNWTKIEPSLKFISSSLIYMATCLEIIFWAKYLLPDTYTVLYCTEGKVFSHDVNLFRRGGGGKGSYPRPEASDSCPFPEGCLMLTTSTCQKTIDEVGISTLSGNWYHVGWTLGSDWRIKHSGNGKKSKKYLLKNTVVMQFLFILLLSHFQCGMFRNQCVINDKYILLMKSPTINIIFSHLSVSPNG